MKALWLYRHQPDLADKPSSFQQNIFDQGKDVGTLATKMFPTGILIKEDYKQPDQALATTAEVMKKTPDAIFEAAFQFSNVLIRVDILRNNKDGSWDLIEVKSTNSVEPKAHYDDVAIQKWVLANCGIKIRHSILMHLNREYYRSGNLDLEKLFVLEIIDSELAPILELIPNELDVIQANLNASNPPDIQIGIRCGNPYDCEFTSHCWKHVGHGSIHTLGRISEKKREALIDRGIESIKDIPDNFELSANQVVELRSFKEDAPQIDLQKIKTHLKGITYPLYFLDYESVAYAVPKFDGSWPHRHIVTQYSLHIQQAPGQPLEHKSYLHSLDTDSSASVAKSLLKEIPNDGGSIVVYHQTYEKERTKELADALPEISNHLLGLVERMWDLEGPFAKRWYWDKKFDGSSSIKAVLPVFRPEFSYDDLVIQKGDHAQIQFAQMIREPSNKPQHLAIREALLRYCERDSLAMVMILEELLRIAG